MSFNKTHIYFILYHSSFLLSLENNHKRGNIQNRNWTKIHKWLWHISTIKKFFELLPTKFPISILVHPFRFSYKVSLRGRDAWLFRRGQLSVIQKSILKVLGFKWSLSKCLKQPYSGRESRKLSLLSFSRVFWPCLCWSFCEILFYQGDHHRLRRTIRESQKSNIFFPLG